MAVSSRRLGLHTTVRMAAISLRTADGPSGCVLSLTTAVRGKPSPPPPPPLACPRRVYTRRVYTRTVPPALAHDPAAPPRKAGTRSCWRPSSSSSAAAAAATHRSWPHGPEPEEPAAARVQSCSLDTLSAAWSVHGSMLPWPAVCFGVVADCASPPPPPPPPPPKSPCGQLNELEQTRQLQQQVQQERGWQQLSLQGRGGLRGRGPDASSGRRGPACGAGAARS